MNKTKGAQAPAAFEPVVGADKGRAREPVAGSPPGVRLPPPPPLPSTR